MRLLVLLAMLFTLAACAGSSVWTNPSVPRQQWSADLAACRRQADQDLGPGAYIPPGDERNSSPMTMVDRTGNAKRFDALVGNCMIDKGYRPSQP